MFVFLFFLIIFTLSPNYFCNPVAVPIPKKYYDQRQRGKINVHVNLKDFDIIELFNSDDDISLPQDYEYIYDYSDMTIKPFRFNKTTMSTTTKSSSEITITSKPLNQTISTKKKLMTEINSPVTRIKIKPFAFDTQNMIKMSKYKRFCAPGFTRDKLGNCHSKKITPIRIQQIANLVTSIRDKQTDNE